MPSLIPLLLTMLAPIIWGTTYIVTTQWLPDGYPVTVAMLRALPAGVLMMLVLRQWPPMRQWLSIFILGALNFTIFWVCLFISAYRLPGGVAATLGALQPLIVIGLMYVLFQQKAGLRLILSTSAGVIGVGLLVLSSTVVLDVFGMVAAVIGATSMALGTVFSKRWRGEASLAAFTAWQLTAGGLLLLPLSFYLEPSLPPLDSHHIAGLLWLGIAGSLLSYLLWFNGVAKLNAVQVSTLGFLSPVTAILLGWVLLGQSLSVLQLLGVGIIFASIFITSLLTTGLSIAGLFTKALSTKHFFARGKT